MRIERVVLEHHRYTALGWSHPLHGLAANRDCPRGDRFETADHAQQSGLAAARGADKDNELAMLDGEIDALDHGDIAEGLGNV